MSGNGLHPVLYRRTRRAITFLQRPFFHMQVIDAHHVPAEGGVVLCANHASFIDPILLALACPRPVRFMMLARFATMPVIGRLARTYGAFAVDQERPGRETVSTARNILRQGDVLGIFPEGGRTRDGRLMPGRPGAVNLALREKVPIVPAGLIGTWESYPAGRLLPRPRPLVVRFGPPLFFHQRPGAAIGREELPPLVAELMSSIAALLHAGD